MSRLERVANVAVILTCLTVTGHILHRYMSPSGPAPTYRAGEHIPEATGLGVKANRQTLLLVTASTCHFCTESMPFYRKVAEAARGAGTALVAATPEPP